MSTVKKAISFREMKDQLEEFAIIAAEGNRPAMAHGLREFARRIDTEALTYGRAPSVPGLDDAHKMPSREYWRYYFAAAMVPVSIMEYQVGGRPMALLCREHAEALLDELQGDEATETQLLESEIDRLKIELGNAERELLAERDRLRDALEQCLAHLSNAHEGYPESTASRAASMCMADARKALQETVQ